MEGISEFRTMFKDFLESVEDIEDNMLVCEISETEYIMLFPGYLWLPRQDGCFLRKGILFKDFLPCGRCVVISAEEGETIQYIMDKGQTLDVWLLSVVAGI